MIVTTGTGSGKTESFLIPVINQLLKEKENGTLDAGVRTLIIYPISLIFNTLHSMLINLNEQN